MSTINLKEKNIQTLCMSVKPGDGKYTVSILKQDSEDSLITVTHSFFLDYVLEVGSDAAYQPKPQMLPAGDQPGCGGSAKVQPEPPTPSSHPLTSREGGASPRYPPNLPLESQHGKGPKRTEGPMPDEPSLLACFSCTLSTVQYPPPHPQHACVLSSLYTCMCVRFTYVSQSVCPRCVTMLHCMNIRCVSIIYLPLKIGNTKIRLTIVQISLYYFTPVK